MGSGAVVLCWMLAAVVSAKLQGADGTCSGIDGEFNDWTGVITSPRKGLGYPNDEDCTWIIAVSRGNKVFLSFIEFVLEGRLQDVCYDYVEIYDGFQNASTRIGQYCGNNVTTEVLSSSNILTIVFHSDGSQGFKGFKANYTGICSGIQMLANDSAHAVGTIESPNHPNPSPSNVSCDWLIATDVGNKVDIRVLTMDLSISADCDQDFLAAFNGRNESSNVIDRACGNETVSFSSTVPWLYLTFQTGDAENGTHTGFKLEYSASAFLPCEYQPCLNNATCTNHFLEYACTCMPGFVGGNCETDIDECQFNPCHNGAVCVDAINSYLCLCIAGYSGKDCETDINECGLESATCNNGGTCVDGINAYSCRCTDDYKGPTCDTPSNIPMCPAEVDNVDGSRISWNHTDGDSTAIVPCPPGIMGQATRFCTLVSWTPPVAEWDSPNLTDCVSPEFALLREKIESLDTGNVTADMISHVTDLLRNITMVNANEIDGTSKQMYPGDLLVSVDALQMIALAAMETDGLNTSQISQGFADSVSNCLDASTYTTWKNTNDEDLIASSVTTMVNSTELLAEAVVRSNAAEVRRQRRRRDLTSQIRTTSTVVNTPNLDFNIIVMETGGNSTTIVESSMRSFTYSGGHGQSVITIPLHQLGLESILEEDGFVGIFAANFHTLGDLFSLLNNTDKGTISTEKPPLDSTGIVKEDYVNSDVMSAAVLGAGIPQYYHLTHPVVMVFEHKMDIGAKDPQCVFMNMHARSISDQWRGDGCEVHITNITHTVCHCYHMTNFALIMDIHNLKEVLPAAHNDVLSIISYIGGTLSVLGCVFSVCVFEFFRLKFDRIRVHENLAAAIAATQIIFLVGINKTENEYVCKSVAAFLHYFLTALFLWMLIEGLSLYVALVKVFDRCSNIKKYMALGWGAPVLVVGVAVGIFYNEYGTGGSCWLPTETLLVVFAPTAALVIFFNVFILIVVIKVMLNSMTVRTKRQEFELTPLKSGLKATLVLFPLLGTAWAFGFLSINNDTLIFTYAFVALNSMQGLFFCVAHCILNPDVKKAFKRRYGDRRTTRSSAQHHNSSSNPMTVSGQLNKSAAAKSYVADRWSVRLTKVNANSDSANLTDGFDNPVTLEKDMIEHHASSHDGKHTRPGDTHYQHPGEPTAADVSLAVNSERGNSDIKGISNKKTRRELYLSETVLLREKK